MILILISILLSLAINAETQIMLGSYTYHYSNVGNEYFKNKVNSRAITNPLIGIKHTEIENGNYKSKSWFLGEDSIGSPIVGFGASGGSDTKLLQIGYVIGFYLYDPTPWNKTEIRPYGIAASDSIGIVPIIGLELNIKLTPILRINTILTPILTNSTLGVTIDF